MKRKLYGCLLVFGVILVLAVLVCAASPPGQLFIMAVFEDWRGPFDKPLFQAVVEEVRRRGIEPGDRLALRLERMDDPGSLRPQKQEDRERGLGAGNVWALRKPGGELIVIIETRDKGHSGEYGYAYAEIPPELQGYGDRLRVDAEVNLSCTEPDWKIEEGWWKVQACDW